MNASAAGGRPESRVRLHRLASPWPAVKLWWFDLEQALSPAAVACLSPDERARAQRFHFAEDRHRFQVGRAAMRETLGAALHVDAASVPLGRLPQGKPVLVDQPGDGDWHFNLSHSGSIGLLGLTRQAPLGVDIERARPMGDLPALAREHFTPEERAALDAAPTDQRLRTFLRVWTRKEACLKAWGTGLSLPTGLVEVGALPLERAVVPPDPALAGVLRVCSLSVPDNEGCEAAVALGTAGSTRRDQNNSFSE